MLDMGAPCTSVELHLLAQLLDAGEEGVVSYSKLADGFSEIR